MLVKVDNFVIHNMANGLSYTYETLVPNVYSKDRNTVPVVKIRISGKSLTIAKNDNALKTWAYLKSMLIHDCTMDNLPEVAE